MTQDSPDSAPGAPCVPGQVSRLPFSSRLWCSQNGQLYSISLCQFWSKEGVDKLGLRNSFLFIFYPKCFIENVFLLQRIAKERQKQYNILIQRIEREKKLFVVAQKIQTRKDLLVRRESVRLSFLPPLVKVLTETGFQLCVNLPQ